MFFCNQHHSKMFTNVIPKAFAQDNKFCAAVYILSAKTEIFKAINALSRGTGTARIDVKYPNIYEIYGNCLQNGFF